MIVDNTIDNDETVKKVLIRVNWPSRIVYSQKLDSGKFGATFYDFPSFPHKSINTNSIWVICGMLLRVKEIWYNVTKTSLYTSK